MTGKLPVNVQKYAHTFWYGALRRDMIRSGEVQRLVETYGVSGFDLNLGELEHAISEGRAYDDAICEASISDPSQILEQLTVEDARAVADFLRPIYDRSEGASGYVAVDVSPLKAASAEALLREAERLFTTIDRPNVMIKMPGTATNLTAIEEALFAGVNVLITLIFSAQHYASAVECYLRALERRLYAGTPIDTVASAVSFGVGNVDALVDKLLQNNIRSAQGRGDLSRVSANRERIGRVALSNARAAYRRFKDVFYGERFAHLYAAGAHVQRLLWCEMQPLNPLYDGALYLDHLAVPDTISLVLEPVLQMVSARGGIPAGREHAMEAVPEALNGLVELGIDLEIIGRQLQGDGVEMLEEAFDEAIDRVGGKRQLLSSGFNRRQRMVLGVYQDAVESELRRLREQKSIVRMWAHDPTLWKDTPEHTNIIASRLGWLNLPSSGQIDRERLRALRDESRTQGWQHVVVMGMGGSILAAEVLWGVFGPQPGYPSLIVLNSTDPAMIRRVEQSIDLTRTLFVVASKTGKTLETLALQQYFYERCREALGAQAGAHFIAITDPGSDLEEQAREYGFRHILLNPPDMNGRYAALSYLGLAPAALVGLEAERILDTGAEMQAACGSNVMGSNHPGLRLGVVLAVLARQGRDKLTLFTSPEIAPIGDWIEQLVAASTGKEGQGIVPVIGSTVGLPHDYDDDRLIVHMRLEGVPSELESGVRRLQQAGHPVVTLELRDRYDLGAEFYRWAFATAVAGMVLGIDPFDEPNVAEGKRHTARLLEALQQAGSLPEEPPVLVEDNVALYADAGMKSLLEALQEQHDYQTTRLSGLLAAFLSLARSGDYVSLLAYVPPYPEYAEALNGIGRRIRHILKRAVTLGFGPRSLHSTGQLHKGGPNTGVFIMFTATDEADLPVPGTAYGFSALKRAEAVGDLEALRARGRRIVRVDLGTDVAAGLEKVTAALEAAAEKRE